MTNLVDDFLIHYGVKGMKWGRRRSDSSTESLPERSRKAKVKAIALTAGALSVVGAVVVMKAIEKNGNSTMSSLNAKPTIDSGKKLADSQASTRFDAKTRMDFSKFELPQTKPMSFDMNAGAPKASAPKASAPKASVPKASSPKASSPKASAPKAPSPYPTTPLIPTPILDEIVRKYGL